MRALHVDFRAGGDELLDHARVAAESGQHERRASVGPGVMCGLGGEQEPHDVGLVKLGGKVERGAAETVFAIGVVTLVKELLQQK